MGYGKLEANIPMLEEELRSLRLEIAAGSETHRQVTTIKEFLFDRNNLPESELCDKWKGARFQEFYDSLIVVGRLAEAIVVLRGQPRLKSRLKTVLGGPLTQDFDPQRSKDIFYELELASQFRMAGFNVSLEEPDMRIAGNGLSREYGVACKYPQSESQILDKHISKGYDQIKKRGLAGFIAFGLDLMAFANRPKILDFRGGATPPIDVAQNELAAHALRLIETRKRDYPEEKPIDGAMFTLSCSGAYGEPAGIATLRAVMLQCGEGNPMLPDLVLIKDKLLGLNANFPEK